MAVLTSAQFTLRDDTDIVIALEPPVNAIKDMLWLDLGANPIILKRWGGAEGTIGGNPINSNNNYFIPFNDSGTIVTITNASKGFGIYDLTATISSGTGIIINGNSLSGDIQGEGTNLEIIADGELNLTAKSGSFWCPINDETEINNTIQQLNETIGDLQKQIASFSICYDEESKTGLRLEDKKTIIEAEGYSAVSVDSSSVKIHNVESFDLFNYRITKNSTGGISFFPIGI